MYDVEFVEKLKKKTPTFYTGNNREFGYRELPVDALPDDRMTTAAATSCNSNGVGSAADKTVSPPQGPNSSSPKLRLKFHKFWGANNKFSRTTDDTIGMGGGSTNMTAGAVNNCSADFTGEERQKRRGFAHYDVQSLTATVGLASKLQNMLSRRRNTATGASAASMLATRSSTPESGDEDIGDGKHNNLLDRYDIILIKLTEFLKAGLKT